jgi:hypothetical protein
MFNLFKKQYHTYKIINNNVQYSYLKKDDHLKKYSFLNVNNYKNINLFKLVFNLSDLITNLDSKNTEVINNLKSKSILIFFLYLSIIPYIRNKKLLTNNTLLNNEFKSRYSLDIIISNKKKIHELFFDFNIDFFYNTSQFLINIFKIKNPITSLFYSKTFEFKFDFLFGSYQYFQEFIQDLNLKDFLIKLTLKINSFK